MNDPAMQKEEAIHTGSDDASNEEKARPTQQGDLALSDQESKTILRKIDVNIIPYCSLLYLLSFLDRVNIGQAAVAGLKQDLKIATGNAYQIALSVFVSTCANIDST